MLMTYQFEGDKLNLTITDGQDRAFVTLEKRRENKAEQGNRVKR